MSPVNRMLLLLIVLAVSCRTGHRVASVSYQSYTVAPASTDSIVPSWLSPFAADKNAKMNDVVAHLAHPLRKSDPDYAIGHFMADAYLAMARKKFASEAAIAFMNGGGIRLNELPAGALLRGQVYEVMPFDNQMVLLTVRGDVLLKYLRNLIKDQNTGVSGVEIRVKEGRLMEVRIGKELLDTSATYLMVQSDYVVKESSNESLFRNVPLRETNYLMREAILDYCKDMERTGRLLAERPDKRVIHE